MRVEMACSRDVKPLYAPLCDRAASRPPAAKPSVNHLRHLLGPAAQGRCHRPRRACLGRQLRCGTWPRTPLTVDSGVITHTASGRSATYGQLAARAATLPVPETVALKDDPRTSSWWAATSTASDSPAKTDGSKARFAMDVNLPGMLTAVVAHPTRFGGAVKSFNDTAARKVPGVVNVVQIPTGVAVVAMSFWAAKQGRDALDIVWDESKAETRSSSAILADYKARAATAGKPAKAAN